MRYQFSSYSELTAERLILRFPNTNDREALYTLRSNAIVNQYITRKIPESLTDVDAFIVMISKNIAHNKNLYWVITLKSTKEVIGTIAYHNFSDDYTYGEIGYELHPSFHKKGYMSEAIEKVLSFGFITLQLTTIEAFTHKLNLASKSLLLKHDFIYQPERRDQGFENNRIFQLKR